jgi:hypothetical protein
MLAVRARLRTVFRVLAVCLISITPMYAQGSAPFHTSKMPGNRIGSGAWLAKCEASSVNSSAAWRLTDGIEPSPAMNDLTGDLNVSGPQVEVCLDATLTARPSAPIDNPCLQSVAGTVAVSRTFPCNQVEDTIPAELSALGKTGLKIERAREDVLSILRSENACTAWFETKEPAPAATFQSLDFLIDQNGPHEVFESNEKESIVFVRQPYVARAMQDGGAHTVITINANGAFYRPLGQVLKMGREAGPLKSDGTRLLMVGTYMGDTLPAQMVTLLHEFGHIIDLLPEDADNLDGKSVRNTDEVLRHCRSEIESRAQQAKQTGK